MESLNLFKYSRAATLILLSKIEEHKWDVQPENFPNTIRWNAGHVYITAEDFLNKADHNYKITPPEWVDLFLDGTRPSEWKDKDVPSTEEIIDRKSTRLNSSHVAISYAVFCLKKKKTREEEH